MCSKKLTGSQLSLQHGINKKWKRETKNKMISVIGPVESHYDESEDDERDELRSGWGGESRREWWGWLYESGSGFKRRGDAYLNEQSVIFKEEMVGGRERVTTDEERVLWGGRREIRFWR